MDDRACHALATEAAGSWGKLAGPLRLIQRRENAVFEARFDGGLHAALRLHRPGYQGRDAVAQEMLLTERLADTGFACPWPQRTRDGALLVETGGAVLSLVQWVEGETLANAPREALPRLYRDLGALLADLHLTADAVAPNLSARPAWDDAAFCGEAPLWGRYWEHPALDPAERALLCAARDAARPVLQGMPASARGVIHADALMENVLIAPGQMTLIDFDDCGIGFRAHDLATALIQHLESDALPAFMDALLDGYGAAGAHLEDPAESVELFLMLRAMASCGWAATRLKQDDIRQKIYSARAVIAAGAFLGR